MWTVVAYRLGVVAYVRASVRPPPTGALIVGGNNLR